MLLKDELKVELDRLENDINEITSQGIIDHRQSDRVIKLRYEKDIIENLIRAQDDESGTARGEVLVDFLGDLRADLHDMHEKSVGSIKEEDLELIDMCDRDSKREEEIITCIKTILDERHPELKRIRYINLAYEGLMLENEEV